MGLMIDMCCFALPKVFLLQTVLHFSWGGDPPYTRVRYFEGWLDIQLLEFGTHNGPQEHSKCLASVMGLGRVYWPAQVKETLLGEFYGKEISTSHEGNMSPQHSM